MYSHIFTKYKIFAIFLKIAISLSKIIKIIFVLSISDYIFRFSVHNLMILKVNFIFCLIYIRLKRYINLKIEQIFK